MEIDRNKFQGVLNIIRFNWHFYVIVILFIIALLLIRPILPEQIQVITTILICFSLITLINSLVISLYVYDLSGFYQLDWLPDLSNKKVLTINAGFDETSLLIEQKFKTINLNIGDFYNPDKHTEISIERAQKAFPSPLKTIKISTNKLLYKDFTFDYILLILSAHEIRNQQERTDFFKELNRITKTNGKIIVVEHLRDWNNFLAYTLGYFHFLSLKTWQKSFENAQLKIEKQTKHTAFITIFKLQKDGNSL